MKKNDAANFNPRSTSRNRSTSGNRFDMKNNDLDIKSAKQCFAQPQHGQKNVLSKYIYGGSVNKYSYASAGKSKEFKFSSNKIGMKNNAIPSSKNID